MSRESKKPTIKQMQALLGEMTTTLEQQNQMLIRRMRQVEHGYGSDA